MRAVVLLGLLLLLAACGQRDAASITLSEFTIKPKNVEARAGAPLTLTVTNAGRIEHNLAVEGQPLVTLAPGERKTITFTPPSGTVIAYQCTIPGHAPAGMTGTLKVA